MPKGHKSINGYSTVTIEYGGMDYRNIATKMTDAGFKMNHATARNIFLKAMKKFAKSILKFQGVESEAEVDRIAKDPRFQSAVIEIANNFYPQSSTDYRS
jgi:hypothetical protein